MRIDWSFPRQVLMTLGIVSVLGAYPLFRFGGSEILRPVGAGAALALVNVLLGYAAIEFSFNKPAAVFFKFVLGGMGIRMIFLAATLVAFIKADAMPAGPLIGSMVFFYVTFLVLEIFYMQKKVDARNNSVPQ